MQIAYNHSFLYGCKIVCVSEGFSFEKTKNTKPHLSKMNDFHFMVKTVNIKITSSNKLKLFKRLILHYRMTRAIRTNLRQSKMKKRPSCQLP